MIHLELLCTPSLISETAPYLAKVAETYGVPARQSKRLCFVIESIMDMRMRELEKSDPTLVVEAKIDRNRLVISITDKGLPYVLTENEKKALHSGLADSYIFEQLGSEGQRISLFFNLTGKNEALEFPEIEEEVLLDTDFTCRLTADTDEDIIHVIQCIYSAYGYNYLHQELYHTDAFKKMLRSGGYISELVENAHHQVLGHIALEEQAWFPGLVEACNLVVKPMARKHNLANVLFGSVIEQGAQYDLRGAYGRPVMQHPISQKLLTQHAYTPCGMYFHILPAEAVKGRDEKLGPVDTAYCIHAYDTTSTHELYVPHEYQAFIQDVFNKEHMPATFKEGATVKPTAKTTAVNYKVDTVSKLLEIKVDAVGIDLDERLNGRPGEKDLENVDVITAYINMNDPGCPVGCERLKDLGFIFCGCLPGSKTYDYLIMQHLRGLPVVKEGIVAEPDYAEMLEKLYAINGI